MSTTAPETGNGAARGTDYVIDVDLQELYYG
jgi:hypothetical protein